MQKSTPKFPCESRVCGGEGDDYDEGTVDHYTSSGKVVVRWDSGVVTETDPRDLDAMRGLSIIRLLDKAAEAYESGDVDECKKALLAARRVKT